MRRVIYKRAKSQFTSHHSGWIEKYCKVVNSNIVTTSDCIPIILFKIDKRGFWRRKANRRRARPVPPFFHLAWEKGEVKNMLPAFRRLSATFVICIRPCLCVCGISVRVCRLVLSWDRSWSRPVCSRLILLASVRAQNPSLTWHGATNQPVEHPLNCNCLWVFMEKDLELVFHFGPDARGGKGRGAVGGSWAQLWSDDRHTSNYRLWQ